MSSSVAGVKDVRMCKCVRVNLVVVSAAEAPPTNQRAVSFVLRSSLGLIMLLERQEILYSSLRVFLFDLDGFRRAT